VKLIPELFDQGYEFVLWLDADALSDATARNAALEQELTSLRSSRSWRVTAPLRRIGKTLRFLASGSAPANPGA
jgi:hypothetical protein